MTDYLKRFEQDRVKAAEHYAEARKLEAQRNYDGAIKSYEQSLQFYDDEIVKAAYFKLLATIGPR